MQAVSGYPRPWFRACDVQGMSFIARHPFQCNEGRRHARSEGFDNDKLAVIHGYITSDEEETMLWIGLGIGLMIGGFLGMLIISLGVVAARADQDQERFFSRNADYHPPSGDPNICRSDDTEKPCIY